MRGFDLAPTLETERLRLRAYRADDFPHCYASWADPDVVRYITGRASTEEETWARMLRNAGLWPLIGYGYWAVEEKASGAFVGDLGFADFRRDIEPSMKGIPEMGWVLVPAAHGKGYATEAGRAALRWGETQWGAGPVVCIIDPANAPSIRVAEKLGFREIAQTSFHEHACVMMRRG